MGYKWEGMKKITYEEALELFHKADIGIFLLYDDDTEALVETEADIHNHQKHYGEFGYEIN